MSFRPLYTSKAGIHHAIRDNGDGTQSISSTQEIDPILDANQAMATHNDGYSASREWRRVGSIPLGLIQFWKETEGWDAFNPEHADKLKAKLNDIDFQKLRTAPGRIGMSNGVMR